jgi:hypothetical protein
VRQFFLSTGMPCKAIHGSAIAMCVTRIPVVHLQSAEGEIKEYNNNDLTCINCKRQTVKSQCPLTSGGKNWFCVVLSTGANLRFFVSYSCNVCVNLRDRVR